MTSLANEGLCVRSLESPRSLTLTGPSALVWTMADGAHSIGSMARRIAKHFWMSYAAAKCEVEACLADFRKAGVILAGSDRSVESDARSTVRFNSEGRNGPDESHKRFEKGGGGK